jgi:hypothetical protein
VKVSATYWYLCCVTFSTQHHGIKMSSKEIIHWIVIYLDLETFGAQCRRFLNRRWNLGCRKSREYVRTCSLSPSSNADVKNAWTYISISLYALMVSRDNFIFHISVSFLNPFTPELNPSKQPCPLEFLLGILNFNAYS